MNKQLLVLLLAIISINCYSQITFENGYFIDNFNKRIECQIKNEDWKDNPTEFEYKLLGNDDVQKATITSVKEFAIENTSKYIRASVDIDRSSDVMMNMSKERNPTFKLENLFLKVLVEGKSNLYEYVDGNIRRFFFDVEKNSIKQLTYKKYLNADKNVATNNRFRQQLWQDLKCDKITKDVNKINYNKGELISFFMDYNNCQNTTTVNYDKKVKTVNYDKKVKRDLFNLTIRPRLNISSLTLDKASTFETWNFDFPSKTTFGIGVEAEYILPFNKNKWSVVFEPNFEYYRSEQTIYADNVSGGKLVGSVNYTSIQFPIGIRHYIFLNSKSLIFINALVVPFESNGGSEIEFRRGDNSLLNSVVINTSINFALGVGYKIHNKYGLELRYYSDKEVLLDISNANYNTDYHTASFIFGYTLF